MVIWFLAGGRERGGEAFEGERRRLPLPRGRRSEDARQLPRLWARSRAGALPPEVKEVTRHHYFSSSNRIGHVVFLCFSLAFI